MVRKCNVNGLERKTMKMGIDIDRIEGQNGIFHDEVLLNLENVVQTNNKHTGNIDLREAIEMMEDDNHDEDNEEYSDIIDDVDKKIVAMKVGVGALILT
jgi:hypothetical protein